MHIYYTWFMWLCGMNPPQQIGHILLRCQPRLRREPITTALLQSRAKITKIPTSSPEHRGEAARKTLKFPFRLALQILAEITHPLLSLPANDSPSLRDQRQREKSREIEERGGDRGKRGIDGGKRGRPIITEDGCVPRAGDFQTGTVNIGDMEISDTAGYPMSAGG